MRKSVPISRNLLSCVHWGKTVLLLTVKMFNMALS